MKLARLADPNFHSALSKLAGESLPLKLAFRLKGIVKLVNENVQHYEEVRQAALQKHGVKDAEGQLMIDEITQNVKFDSQGYEEFIKEFAMLSNEEIEVPTIKVSELGDKISMTLEELNLLDGLVVED